MNQFWTTVLKMVGTKFKMSNAYHPKTTAQMERTNYTLEHLLTMYVGHCQGIWE